MRLYGISVDFHNYLTTPPVPWNMLILFGTNRYKSHLLCQLYFCTIFQGQHWPTVHEKITLVPQICSSVLTFRNWDMSVGEILFPGQNVAISDWKGKSMGMYKWCLTPRYVSEGHLKSEKYSTVLMLNNILTWKTLKCNQINETAAATKYLTTEKHGASGNGSKKSPDQSLTGFKMIFSHQNLGIDTSYVQISVISAEIWHKI